PDYVQHNPVIPNGPQAIARLIPSLKSDLSYEFGMVVAEGDLVMVHGRYVGWGLKPLVAVDIFRVKDGKVVEHWDVMQDEVPASATRCRKSRPPPPDRTGRTRSAENRSAASSP